MKAKIVLVDDHPLIRLGVRMALKSSSDKIEIVGEFGSGKELDSFLQSGAMPDLVLLDLLMPDENGCDIAERIKRDYPYMAILIMSSDLSPEMIMRLVNVGVDGYISKNYTDNELNSAIESVLDGFSYFGKDVSKIIRDVRLSKSLIPDSNFSPRELEIIKCCRDGLTAKEIADKLCLSPRTVSNYKQNIFSKMGINNNHDMIAYALKMGIITSF